MIFTPIFQPCSCFRFKTCHESGLVWSRVGWLGAWLWICTPALPASDYERIRGSDNSGPRMEMSMFGGRSQRFIVLVVER